MTFQVLYPIRLSLTFVSENPQDKHTDSVWCSTLGLDISEDQANRYWPGEITLSPKPQYVYSERSPEYINQAQSFARRAQDGGRLSAEDVGMEHPSNADIPAAPSLRSSPLPEDEGTPLSSPSLQFLDVIEELAWLSPIRND